MYIENYNWKLGLNSFYKDVFNLMFEIARQYYKV